MTGGDIGKIENGRLKPYDSQLRKLARALKWPAADAPQLMDETPTQDVSAVDAQDAPNAVASS
jgi:hypothetical protein